MQGLCTLPSRAKKTITEIKSNFSNEDRWELKDSCSGKWLNHSQGREGWIQLSQKITRFFLPLFQNIYSPRTVTRCLFLCLFFLGFLLLKIKHVTLAALPTAEDLNLQNNAVSRPKMPETDYYKVFVHSYPVILNSTENCIVGHTFFFIVKRHSYWSCRNSHTWKIQ